VIKNQLIDLESSLYVRRTIFHNTVNFNGVNITLYLQCTWRTNITKSK